VPTFYLEKDIPEGLREYFEPARVTHPTVKPCALVAYLTSLCTREGETVLDPFCGSGSTGVAAALLGRRFVGIELSEDFAAIARARIAHAAASVSEQSTDTSTQVPDKPVKLPAPKKKSKQEKHGQQCLELAVGD
jgi:DNA modification methylase